MSFGPVEPFDLVALEQRVLRRWREQDLARRVWSHRSGGPRWIFYEGPPTANGRPGLHHVWARAFKDLYPRYRTMRGYDVPRKGGWDCHGLPVEIEVEKDLGLTSKDQIEQFGIAEFNERCRRSVQRYVADWEALTERAGIWIDTDDAYWTMSSPYVESVWWLLRQLFDAGLLTEGHRVVPYCPRCGTALSSHELGQPGAYRDVTDVSAYVRFPLVGDDADLVVWTTTPWTLISNVAAAVGPDIEYVRVRDPEGGRDLILAAERAPEDAEVVDHFTGAELAGRRYHRPFDVLPIDERGERVVTAAFVSTEDGTGVVHLAPAFGADDMEAADVHDLPVLNPVDQRGRFDASAGRWEGRGVKETDADVVDDLAARGLLVRSEPYTHSYPHCWRCGTALVYWAKTSWFVRTSQRRRELLAQNELVDWHPEHIKHGRFGDWLENNVDWALSRDRYWGTPLPIWRCVEGHDTCIGSLAELAALAGLGPAEAAALDPHRPYVDEVSFPCPTEGCGAPARRLEPVIDAWFDSGAMPSAQHGYPTTAGSEAGMGAAFPADFICEAIDQTRGWFYSLLAVNTLVFSSTPYRAVVCLGLLVDENGQKMSKSRGNVVDPWDVFARSGADALRWWFFSAGSPWGSRRVHGDAIDEAARRTLLTLWNVLHFFTTYADIDGWSPEPGSSPSPVHVMDRWVLDRLDETAVAMSDALDRFDALSAASSLARFVDDLSNWYVRRSRARFWGGDAPHAVLHRCLLVTSRLLAPFCPMLAEEVHAVLMRGAPPDEAADSVHLTDWPSASLVVEPAEERRRLAAEMEAARQLVGLGRAARTEAGIPTRQPLPRALVLHPGVDLSPEVATEVAEELNVKRLEDVESLAGVMSWTVVPNFRALGPRLGRRVNEVKAALAAADGAELRRALDTEGEVVVAGERLGPDDVEVRPGRHPGFAVGQQGPWAVALDLEVDEGLRSEGVARHLAHTINGLRKQAGFELSQRVVVRIEPGSRVAAALEAHGQWVADQVLATELSVGPADEGARVEVDGEPVRVVLVPLNGSGGASSSGG